MPLDPKNVRHGQGGALTPIVYDDPKFVYHSPEENSWFGHFDEVESSPPPPASPPLLRIFVSITPLCFQNLNGRLHFEEAGPPPTSTTSED